LEVDRGLRRFSDEVYVSFFRFLGVYAVSLSAHDQRERGGRKEEGTRSKLNFLLPSTRR